MEITSQLVLKDLRGKYKGTILGYLWSIATPLIMALVLDIAFRRIVRIQVDNYSLFLITGLFTWQWFNVAVNASTRIFIDNASLIKKVVFPRHLLPLSLTLVEGIHFLMSIPVIIFFLAYHGLSWTHLSWIYGLPTLFLLHLLITYGITLIASSINALFRDMERIVILGTTMLFYLTPVIYPTTMIPPDLLPYFRINPFTDLIELWRQLFMQGIIDWSIVARTYLVALASLSMGSFIFSRLSPRFAEVV